MRRPRARARGPAFPAWVARAVASQRGSGGRTRWQAPASRPRGDCRYGVPWARQPHPGGRARGSHPSRAPDLRQLQRRLGWPSPAAYRAVELPSPTAGQTDCRRAVRPWTRSGGKNTVPDTTADPPGCGPAPGTRLSVRMKAIPAQSGRCYRSCPELPAAEPGRRRVSVQPAGAAFRRRVEAHVVPLTVSESAFRAESRTRSSSSWRAATLAPYHDAVGDWRSPSPGPAHYFPATSSKATAPGKPAAAAIRFLKKISYNILIDLLQYPSIYSVIFIGQEIFAPFNRRLFHFHPFYSRLFRYIHGSNIFRT